MFPHASLCFHCILIQAIDLPPPAMRLLVYYSDTFDSLAIANMVSGFVWSVNLSDLYPPA